MQKSNTISTISELVDELPDASFKDYARLLRNLEVTKKELEGYAHFCEDNYVRHCFVHTEKYELLMLCWDENQETPVHAHDGQNCWVKVLEGEINERLYKKDQDGELVETKTSLLQKGEISYMNDELGLHKLGALNGKALSLHLYAEPIQHCKIYDNEGELVAEKEMEYDSIGC